MSNSTEDSTSQGSRHLVRSSAIVAIGTGLSRLTGFLRVGVMAYAIGATALAEAYNLANNTPNLLYDLVLGGILSATLVPVVVAHTGRNNNRGIDALATVITVVLVLATILAIALSPVIIHLYNLTSTTSDASTQAIIAVPLLMMFAPQILFYGLTSLGTSLLNARKSFAVPAFAPVLNNIVVICLFLALPHLATGDALTFDQVRQDTSLLLLLGFGTTAGLVAMTLVLWPAMRSAGIRLHWNFDLRDPAVREVGRLSGWTFGYVVTNLIAYGIIQTLANGVEGVSIYAYAWLFFQLPYGLWTVSVMTAYTPELSALSAASKSDEMRHRFASGLRLVLVLALPATLGMMLLAGPLVRLVLAHGEFTTGNAITTANTLIAFLCGLPAFSLFLFAMRGFYAQRNTRLPFYTNLAESLLGLGIAFLLVDRFGVVGLGASGSIAYSVFAVIALFLLHRRIGSFFDHATITAIAKMSVSSLVMAGVVWSFISVTSLSDLMTSVIGGLLGLAVYCVMIIIFRVEEARSVLTRIIRR
ncbi:MAG: murein biosynthesis integral membrane protein MurJ [Acidimicrobiales bacterium]